MASLSRFAVTSLTLLAALVLLCSSAAVAQEKGTPEKGVPKKEASAEGEEEPVDADAALAAKTKELALPVDDAAFEEIEEPAEEARITEEPAAVPEGEKPKLDHDVLMDQLLRDLSSPDEETRLRAGVALKKNAKLNDVPLLVKVLKRGNNREKQLFIIETLGELQDRRSGEALRFEVRHGDIESQRAAVTALGKLRFNWPVPVLVRVLRKAEDLELRKRAASALGEISTTQSEYALRTSLATLEDAVGAKQAAFWALDKIRNKIDDQRIDTSMPEGRRLENYYKGTRYLLYHPAHRRGSAVHKVGLRPWLVVCVHDEDLRADELFNICWRSAKQRQMAVLTPYFDNMRYPEFGDFNIRGDRADKRLIEIVEHVGKHASLTVREFFLFGYGEGGDFAQRFAMTHPRKIAKLAFEANEFTQPDSEIFFPRGIHRSPLAPDIAIDMYPFLKTDTLLILRKNSPVYRESKEYFEAIRHYAEINGIRARMSIRTVDVKFEIWNEAENFLFAYE
jgi:hypothetical protein